MSVRVRFAPSPTGFVHIGGLRTALYNYLFARQNNGTFVLRIEDTDRKRFVSDATDNLIQALEWAGLAPDEGPVTGGDYGPYFQSERLDLYRDYAEQLVQKGVAYYAFDTPEELQAVRDKARENGQPPPKYDSDLRLKMRNSLTLPKEEIARLLDLGEPYVIRLLIPDNREFAFDDLVRGRVSRNSSDIDDQVLIKSDGFPTYHLANVVDDHLMQITHVIRGEEWLSSVPKHIYLYECFEWDMPEMAHLPLIFNPDGTKMSKRDIQTLDELPSGKVDPDVQTYINTGYEKSALINYIALLGWNPGDDREVMNLEELIRVFSLERVNKSAAIFDLKKLDWLNSEHISRKDSRELAGELKPLCEQAGLSVDSDEYFVQVVELLKSRLHFRHEFPQYAAYFFKDPQEYDAKVIKKRWKADSKELLLEFIKKCSKLKTFDNGSIEQTLRELAEEKEVGSGRIIHPVRLAVSGVGVGPGLFEMLTVLGKETVIRRIEKAVNVIPELKEQQM